ncbi:alcohol dehydrogenase catalytic domain-containing protein [Streptacidiphilus monticola]
MRTIGQFRLSEADALTSTVQEAAEPTPGPGQLLVRTEALGVGLGLLRMLRAQRDTRSAPVSPGGEMVGAVTAVGEGVTGYGVGDRVGGVVFDGLYAESVLALPALVSPVPEDVPAAAALALVRGGLVALGALRAGS